VGIRRRRVVWSRGASLELDAAISYIAADAPKTATALLERILESAGSLSTLCDRGRVVPERGETSIRELLVDPFRLVYEIRLDEVVMLGLIHQRQDFDRWSESRDAT
jgi:toxin ParE1/3/4